MALPADQEAMLLLGTAATAALAAVGVWIAVERGGAPPSLSAFLSKRKAASPSAIPPSPVLPKEKLVGLLKSCAIEADAASSSLKNAYDAESRAAMTYAMMGRQAPPRTPLPALFQAVYSKSADNIVIAGGVSEETALASLQYWSSEVRDKEVRLLERRVLAASPVEGMTGKAVIAALDATMQAEYKLWQQAATEVAAAGVEPRTPAFSTEVRRRVAASEASSSEYLVTVIAALGAPWNHNRAKLWEGILTHFVQHDADVQAAVDPATKRQERAVEALGVVGGMRPEPEGEEEGGGIDPQMAALLMAQQQGGGGGRR
jgi:hypothetical protein